MKISIYSIYDACPECKTERRSFDDDQGLDSKGHGQRERHYCRTCGWVEEVGA